MRHLKITHQGKVYEVDVEESGAVVSTAAPVARAAAPAAPVQPTAGSGEALEVEAPMSGRIAKIFVKPGDAVQEGDCLFILEAMKLENAIYADEGGVVKQIFVTQNQIVNTSDVLAVIG